MKKELSLLAKKFPFYFGISFLLLVLIVSGYLFWPYKDYILSKLRIGPPVVAAVNGESILKKDYEARLASQTYFYTEISKLPEKEVGELPNRVLEEMIQEVLLTQILEENKLVVTENEVLGRIGEQSVNKLYGGDWNRYKKDLVDRYKTTLADVARTFRIEILKEKVSSLKDKKHVFAIWVAKNEPQFAKPEDLPLDQRQKIETANKPKKEKAEAALRRIQNNEVFAKVAVETSEDTKSVKEGADLGWLYVPLSVNETSQPTLYAFPGSTAVVSALKNLEAGNVKLYDLFTGYAIIKIRQVQKGPLGNQSFDDWYRSYRTSAKVSFFK